MIEKALKGGRNYRLWIGFLLLCTVTGFSAFSRQMQEGLTVTGMGRDVSWGLYIAQFTFLVGVAASAVMVVIPYYLHNQKAFAKTVIVGEFTAVAATFMCLLFILADLGRPDRVLNVLFYPSLHSVVFWDVLVLNGYLVINLVTSWTVLGAERKNVPPPRWVTLLVYLSIPWAITIHTVTAFLYSGLPPGHHLWLTAVMASRFLASAFAAGTALLILVTLILKKNTGFDVGDEARQKLVVLATYAGVVNVFLIGAECFTAFYSNVPEQAHNLQYLFFGLEGKTGFVPWTWFSLAAGIASLFVLLNPKLRRTRNWLVAACIGLAGSIWIDKGIALILGGFVPSPLGEIVEYRVSVTEIAVTLGVWAAGILLLTALLNVAAAVGLERAE